MLLIQILVWIGLGLLGGRILAKKGYPPVIGIIGGMIGGPLVLLAAWLIVPRTAAGREQHKMELETRQELAEASKTKACPKCGRMNSVAAPVCPRCDHRLIEQSAAIQG